MVYLILGISLVAGVALMGRWLLNAEPRDVLRALKWVAGILAVGVAAFVMFRGRLEWLAYAAPVAIPLLLRFTPIYRAMRNRAKTARGPTPGQSSGVRTRWLAMSLDHDTGAMDGEILMGPFAGRSLSELSADELGALAKALDEDAESRQVFDAWLERMGPEMGSGEPPPGDSDAEMSPARAREILGVEKGADAREIRDAHRRLMLANHPDKGGSSWLAAQINQAKDILLSRG